MNRRHFLKALGAVTAAVSLAPKVLTATTLEEATRPIWTGVDWGAGPDHTVVTIGTQRYGAYTYGDLTAEQREFYSAEILKRLLPQLPLKNLIEDHYREMAQVRLPPTMSINWRKWESLELPTERRLSA